MHRYGRDFSDQMFWARSPGRGYGERDFGGRSFGDRGYRYDSRDYPGRGYYGGNSHYWGSGFGGAGYDRNYGGYGSDFARERMNRYDRGLGYYGNGLDQGLENYYSGTHRNHGPIGRSSNREELIYPPEHRSRGSLGMGDRSRQRYDHGW